MRSATEFVARALGSVRPSGELAPCGFCGTLAPGLPAERVLKENFTNRDEPRAPWVCWACEACLNTRDTRSSHMVADGTFRRLERKEVWPLLLAPPEPPFVVYLTLSGQKHGEVVMLPSVTWYAVGERDRVYRGLKRLKYLGKKGAQGYGLVTSLTVEKVASDPADWTLDWCRVDEEARVCRPARNVPAEWARVRGLRVEGEMTAPLRPPYWRKAEGACCRVAR